MFRGGRDLAAEQPAMNMHVGFRERSPEGASIRHGTKAIVYIYKKKTKLKQVSGQFGNDSCED